MSKKFNRKCSSVRVSSMQEKERRKILIRHKRRNAIHQLLHIHRVAARNYFTFCLIFNDVIMRKEVKSWIWNLFLSPSHWRHFRMCQKMREIWNIEVMMWDGKNSIGFSHKIMQIENCDREWKLWKDFFKKRFRNYFKGQVTQFFLVFCKNYF